MRMNYKKYYYEFKNNIESIVQRGINEFGEETTIHEYLASVQQGYTSSLGFIIFDDNVAGCILRKYDYNTGLTLYYNSAKNVLYFDHNGEIVKIFNYAIDYTALCTWQKLNTAVQELYSMQNMARV